MPGISSRGYASKGSMPNGGSKSNRFKIVPTVPIVPDASNASKPRGGKDLTPSVTRSVVDQQNPENNSGEHTSCKN